MLVDQDVWEYEGVVIRAHGGACGTFIVSNPVDGTRLFYVANENGVDFYIYPANDGTLEFYVRKVRRYEQDK